MSTWFTVLRLVTFGTHLNVHKDTYSKIRNRLSAGKAVYLRAASPKYQLDLEIAKKSNFFKLAHNEALRALVTKISF